MLQREMTIETASVMKPEQVSSTRSTSLPCTSRSHVGGECKDDIVPCVFMHDVCVYNIIYITIQLYISGRHVN
jgi:hypothetical protein